MIWNGKEKELDEEEDTEEEEENEKKVLIPQSAPKPMTEHMTNASCVLGPGTIFTGNIVSNDDVLLSGNLQGNLSTKSNVELSGAIKGDLSVASVTLDGGAVEGSVTAMDTVMMKRGSRIKGNIKAKNVTVSAGASVQGDIHAENLSIEVGSVLQGKLSIGSATTTISSEAPSTAPESPIKVV